MRRFRAALPLGAADIRRASVEALGRRCTWDEAHARHVAGLTMHIFDHSHRLHRLHDDDRELLEYAALLHDIGEHVSVLAQHKVVKLAVMLRLAAALDRGRAQVVDSVGVELSGGRLRLQLRSTRNRELELWATARQAPMLERVFGRRLDLVADGPDRVPQTALSVESVAATAR